ncbi:hypothetical protein, partial [Sinorhizobium medicae]|uniref:hypothetical protein n=1 Tax=Sinorhizobium medicae TaxID=110321 RepID=UPI001AEF32D8
AEFAGELTVSQGLKTRLGRRVPVRHREAWVHVRLKSGFPSEASSSTSAFTLMWLGIACS